MKHRVDAANVGWAEAGILLLLRLSKASACAELIVEFLNFDGPKFAELDLPQLRDDVFVDEHLVVPGGAGPEIGLAVDIIPQRYPLAEGVAIRPDHVHSPAFLNGLF